MLQMAEQTGGRAFINTNDLTHAVAKSIETGSNFYTLAYSPTDTNWNGSFRKILVKLQEQGYTLAYRRGYYADNPNAHPKKGAVAATTPANAPPPFDPMRAAMIHGGPDPTQILINFSRPPRRLCPRRHDSPPTTHSTRLKTKGPYRRYAIDYAADAHDVLFTKSPEDSYQGALRFLVYLYDQDGNLINLVDDKTHATLTAAAYTDLLRHGVPWHQEISVPVKGNFYLRIGLHDLNGDRVAAVEVPIASVKNLPSLVEAKK